jgi:hypothetical protein
MVGPPFTPHCETTEGNYLQEMKCEIDMGNSQVPKTGYFDFAQYRLWDTQFLLIGTCATIVDVFPISSYPTLR